jgi:endoribonuclease Dicer
MFLFTRRIFCMTKSSFIAFCETQYLADLIESIAGAIYIDSKCDKEKVWRAMKRLLEPLATAKTLKRDPVTELKELCEQRNYSTPSYYTTRKDGVTSAIVKVWAAGTLHSRTGTGTGRNKDVMASAAKSLLRKLKEGCRRTMSQEPGK